MPKKHFTDRPVKFQASIPESLHNQIHLLLLDPLRARTRYGAFSKLITKLLYDWLREQRKEISDGSTGTTSGASNESPPGGGGEPGSIRDDNLLPSSEQTSRSDEWKEEVDESFDASGRP